MMPKAADISIADEESHSFKARAPLISERSIRIPAFGFSVFDKQELESEWREYHQTALLAFDGAVSSIRKVIPFRDENQVEGQGTYEIVDGPFDPQDSNREVFQHEFSGYANNACAWVEWIIIAATLKIEKIERDTFIELALKRRVRSETLKAAFENVERKAIRDLLWELHLSTDQKLLLPLYCEELIDAAKQKDLLPEIADLFFEYPNKAFLKLADELSLFHTVGSAALIHDIIAAGYDASAALLDAVYRGNPVQALLDPSEPVRIHAAKLLEKQNDVEGLIICLNNDSPRVREIAGWYVGIKNIGQAGDALTQAISTKKFTGIETYAEIEALRSATWALGVLRIENARPYLERLIEHENRLISQTATTALSKFS